MGKVRRVIVRRVRPAGTKAWSGIEPTNGLRLLDNNTINQFNPTMLDLGDISAPCQEKEAVTAVFDLTGFTTFCNQVDSYLAIPRFLNDYPPENYRERLRGPQRALDGTSCHGQVYG